jgi:hypothetical protein
MPDSPWATQVRDAADASSCLTFNSSSLHMETCKKEAGDKTAPNQSGCTDGNCRFSGIIYQLWYLNALGQFSSAITNIENGANSLLPIIPGFPANTPWCLATGMCAPALPSHKQPTPPERGHLIWSASKSHNISTSRFC